MPIGKQRESTEFNRKESEERESKVFNRKVKKKVEFQKVEISIEK